MRHADGQYHCQECREGIFVGTDPALPLAINTIVATNNTLHRNGDDGIDLARGTMATISGGVITLHGDQGIRLRDGATAAIGLDGAAEIVVSENLGAGIFVTADGSSAQINRGRLRIDANRGGDILGPVTEDVFVDTDRDGLGDADEAARGTDPRNPDLDGDGLTDGEEVHVYGTDPTRADTDGDGLTDGEEVRLYGTNRVHNELLVLNPDTGEAIALGPLTGDAGLAIGAPSQLVDIAWSPDGRTLYALAFVSVAALRRTGCTP